MTQCKVRKKSAVGMKGVTPFNGKQIGEAATTLNDKQTEEGATAFNEEQIEANVRNAKCRGTPMWWSMLQEHYLTGERDCQSFQNTGTMNVFRYPDPRLRRMYVLASLSGKMSYNVFHELLGFPCWTTVKGYRRELKAEIGLTFENFNGQEANLATVLRCFHSAVRIDDVSCPLTQQLLSAILV